MRRGYKNVFFLLLIASVAIAWSGCHTESTEKTSSSISSLGGGRLQASPEPLVFKQVDKIGENDEETIVLKNTSSDGDIHITGLQIIESTDSGRNDFREFSPGKTWLSFNSGPKRIPPAASEKISVKYTARDKYPAKGVLRVFVSGDPNLPEGYYEIPLQSLAREPDIDTINPVTFPRVNLDQWACRDILLTNVGPEALKIKSWTLRDSNRNFRVKLFGQKPTDNLCDDPTPRKLPFSSDPSASFTQEEKDRYNNVIASLNRTGPTDDSLIVPARGHKNKQGEADNYAWIRYYVQPTVGNKQEAQLDLNTNRGRGSEIYTASLEVNTSPDCLILEKGIFPTRELTATTYTETTELRNNCVDASQAAVAVRDVKIKPGSTFFVAEDKAKCPKTNFDASTPGQITPSSGKEFFKLVDPQKEPWPYALSVGEKKPLDIITTAIGDPAYGTAYGADASECTGTYYGTLLVSTDDPTTPQKEFPLKATVVDILRPDAIARACVSTHCSDNELTQSLSVQGTSNSIILKSKSKFYKDGPKTYKWEAISAPESQLKGCKNWANRETGENATYNLTTGECFSTVGDYTFRLTVSQNGVESAKTQQSYVYVSVRPDTDYYIELTWSSSPSIDGTPTENADGADLDLHVIETTSSDCSSELWNGEHAVYHNHRRIGCLSKGNKCVELVYDDTNGLGPESISINAPLLANKYLVGVNYFNTNGWGVVYAVVKIWRIRTITVEGQTKRTPPELVFATLGLPPRGYLTGTNLNFWDVAEIIPSKCESNSTAYCSSVFTHNRFYSNMAYANKEVNLCVYQ